MNIGELFVELGFHADTMKLKEFMHAIGELNMTSIASALGLGTLYEATNKIMGMTGEASENMRKFGDITGYSKQQMDQLGKFAERAGVQFKTAQGFIENMQKELTAVKLGQGNVGFWNFMNIQPAGKNAFQLAYEMHQRFMQHGPEWQRKALDLGGISGEMALMFQASEKQWQLQKKIDVENEKEYAIFEKLRISRVVATQDFTHALEKLAIAIAPTITHILELADKIYEFVKASKLAQYAIVTLIALFISSSLIGAINGIIMGITAIGTAMTAAFAGVAMASWLSGLGEALALITAILAAYNILTHHQNTSGQKLNFWGQLQKSILEDLVPGEMLRNMRESKSTSGGTHSVVNNSTYNIHGVENPADAAARLSQRDRNNRRYTNPI